MLQEMKTSMIEYWDERDRFANSRISSEPPLPIRPGSRLGMSYAIDPSRSYFTVIG